MSILQMNLIVINTPCLLNQKATIGDSIWKVKLSDIDKCIAIYKKTTKDKNITIKIEADNKTEYCSIQESNEMLARCRLHSI